MSVIRSWPWFQTDSHHRDNNVVGVQVHITLNKNSVPGDKSAMVPGGVRIGSPAMTTRGMVESDFVKVADYIDRCAAAPWPQTLTHHITPGIRVAQWLQALPCEASRYQGRS